MKFKIKDHQVNKKKKKFLSFIEELSTFEMFECFRLLLKTNLLTVFTSF